MAERIHLDNHDWAAGPKWEVVRQPAGTSDPMLVRFAKHARTRKLLEQIARWNGDSWDQQRWIPRHPQVPKTLLKIVADHMKRIKSD